MRHTNFFTYSLESISLAVRALRMWSATQFAVAGATAVFFAALIGVATVLIPNPVFTRDIAPVWWNWPVLICTSLGAGMLTASYIRPAANRAARTARTDVTLSGKRSARLGVAGGLLAWFAVGCPVCNKIALLFLGYSGALTWFAPLQPVLAVLALALTLIALSIRLRGQVSCPVSRRDAKATN